MSRWTVVALLAAAFVLGALAEREGLLKSRTILTAVARTGLIAPPLSSRIRNGRDRLQKNSALSECPDPSGRVAVLLTAGQSNAANHGTPYTEPDDVDILNFLDDRCYLARHPLLGATGEGSSPWIATARLLLSSGRFDKVVIVATAIGGTGVMEWAPAGEFHARLLERVRVVGAVLPVTHFLWHQGEHDANRGTAPNAYTDALRSIIHAVRSATGRETPAIIALATRCGPRAANESIRGAQALVASSVPNTFVVDSDGIGFEHRYDGCHFAASGHEILASRYADAISGTLD